MNVRLLPFLAFLLLPVLPRANAFAQTDSVDQAEAKRRGVPLQQVQLEKAQSRIAELEKQVTALQAELRTATQPATTAPTASGIQAKAQLAAQTYVERMNSLPRNLWHTDDENALRVSERDKWLRDNMTIGLGPYTFSGTIVSVTPSKDSNAPVRISVDCGKVYICGANTMLTVNAKISNLKAADALGWKAGDKITVSGKYDGGLPFAIHQHSFFAESNVILLDAIKK